MKLKIKTIDFDKFLDDENKHISVQQWIGSGKSSSVCLYIKKHIDDDVRFLYVAPTIALLEEARKKIVSNVPNINNNIFVWSSEHVTKMSPKSIYEKCRSSKVILMTYTRFKAEIPENLGLRKDDVLFLDEFEDLVHSFKISNMLRELMVHNNSICSRERFISRSLSKNGIKDNLEKLFTCEEQEKAKEEKIRGIVFDNLKEGVKYDDVDDVITINLIDLWKEMKIIRLDATASETDFLYPGFKIVENDESEGYKNSCDVINGHKLVTTFNPTKTYLRGLSSESLNKTLKAILDCIPFGNYQNVYMATFKFLITDEKSFIIKYLSSKYPDYNIRVNQDFDNAEKKVNKSNSFIIKGYSDKNIYIVNYSANRGINGATLKCDATVQLGSFRLGKEEEKIHVAYCKGNYNPDGFSVANIIQEVRGRNRVGKEVDAYILIDREADMAFEKMRPYLYSRYSTILVDEGEIDELEDLKYSEMDKKFLSIARIESEPDSEFIASMLGKEKIGVSNTAVVGYLNALIKNRKNLVWSIFDKKEYYDEYEIIDIFKNKKKLFLKKR